MTPHKYNEASAKQNIELVQSIARGLQPIVVINEEIFEDCYLEKGMKAKIIDVRFNDAGAVVDGKPDNVYEFTLDFSDFDDYNLAFESANWRNNETKEYNQTATESGNKPKDLKETVFHSITHGKLFFDVDNSNNDLYELYRNSDTKLGYVAWLENKVRETL